MKLSIFISLIILLSSCTTYRIGTTPDDVYYSPNVVREDRYVSAEDLNDRSIRQGIRDRRFRMIEDDDWYYWNRSLWNVQMNTWYWNSPLMWNSWSNNPWYWNYVSWNSWNNPWYWNSWNNNYWYNRWRWENRFVGHNIIINNRNNRSTGIRYSPQININRQPTNRPVRFFNNSTNNTNIRTFGNGTNINGQGGSRYFTPSSGNSNSGSSRPAAGGRRN